MKQKIQKWLEVVKVVKKQLIVYLITFQVTIRKFIKSGSVMARENANISASKSN